MIRLNVVAPRPGVDLRAGAGSAFGTFGELLQGVLPDGDVEFLVTFPIDRGSRVRFRLDPGGQLRVYPSHKWKARALARMVMDASCCDSGGTLIIDSDLPVGKGLASSSADLVATARVLGQVLGLEMSSPDIEGWLRRIEPTDGVMYPGVVVFEHKRVRLRSFLGVLPPLTVVAVDEGGQVDTLSFNDRQKPFSTADKREYAELLDRITAAVHAGDLAEVGAVVTRSAVLNQRLQPKRNLAAMLRICEETQALGVVCAHSGTVIGILLADGDAGHQQRLAHVRAACATLPGAMSEFHSLDLGDPGGTDAV
jgi:L-threonine kinase